MDASREPDGTQAPIKAIPVRHPGRWLAAVAIAVLAAMLVSSMVSSQVVRNGVRQDRWQWSTIGHYLFSSLILHGVTRTLMLTGIAMMVGIVGGTALAVMRLSPNPVVAGSSWLYIWFFRGTPVLVQLLFWYFMAYLYPTVSIGVPFGPAFAHISTVHISKLAAAILGLGLNEAAYMAEIVRAGILSVDEGQTEAAAALGMGRGLVMRRIVLPQAMRVIIPPTGNETISMLKTTSLVSFISYIDLLYAAQLIYAQNYQTVPLLLTAAIWYVAMTSVLYVGQYYLERYFARGSMRGLPPTPWQQVRAGVFSLRRQPPISPTAAR